jgi:hypothetical protein
MARIAIAPGAGTGVPTPAKAVENDAVAPAERMKLKVIASGLPKSATANEG